MSAIAASILLTDEMCTGFNGKALLSAIQRFASPGVILVDMALANRPGGGRTLVIGYVFENEGRLIKQYDADAPHGEYNWREHEYTRHEFKVRATVGTDRLDTKMLLAKLALIRG